MKPKIVVRSDRRSRSLLGTFKLDANGLRRALVVAGHASVPISPCSLYVKTGRYRSDESEIGSFEWYSAMPFGSGERQHFVGGELSWLLDVFNVQTSPYVARGKYDENGKPLTRAAGARS